MAAAAHEARRARPRGERLEPLELAAPALHAVDVLRELVARALLPVDVDHRAGDDGRAPLPLVRRLRPRLARRRAGAPLRRRLLEQPSHLVLRLNRARRRHHRRQQLVARAGRAGRAPGCARHVGHVDDRMRARRHRDERSGRQGSRLGSRLGGRGGVLLLGRLRGLSGALGVDEVHRARVGAHGKRRGERLQARLGRVGRRLLSLCDGDEGALRDEKLHLVAVDPLGRDRRPLQLRRLVREDDQPRRHARRRVVDHAELAAAQRLVGLRPDARVGRVDERVVQRHRQPAHARRRQDQVGLLAVAHVAHLVLEVAAAAHEGRRARLVQEAHGAFELAAPAPAVVVVVVVRRRRRRRRLLGTGGAAARRAVASRLLAGAAPAGAMLVACRLLTCVARDVSCVDAEQDRRRLIELWLLPARLRPQKGGCHGGQRRGSTRA